VRRRVVVAVDRLGVVREAYVATEGEPRKARGAGAVASILAEVMLGQMRDGERRCLEVVDEETGRTGPACNHEACKHGPEFSCHRERDDGTDKRFGAEPLESRIALERQHHARREGRGENHRNGIEADLFHLLQHVLDIERPAERPGERMEQKKEDLSDLGDDTGGPAPYDLKPVIDKSVGHGR
jgi:hypothetical protein